MKTYKEITEEIQAITEMGTDANLTKIIKWSTKGPEREYAKRYYYYCTGKTKKNPVPHKTISHFDVGTINSYVEALCGFRY